MIAAKDIAMINLTLQNNPNIRRRISADRSLSDGAPVRPRITRSFWTSDGKGDWRPENRQQANVDRAWSGLEGRQFSFWGGGRIK